VERRRYGAMQVASRHVPGRMENLGGRARHRTDPEEVDLVAVERACGGDLVVSARLLPLERDLAIYRLVDSGVSGLEAARRLGVSSRHVYRVLGVRRDQT
jgi:hypothetical protein